MGSKNWTKEEISYLRKNRHLTQIEIANTLNRTVDAVNCKLRRLRLVKYERLSPKSMIEEVVHFHSLGFSNRYICKRLRLDPRTLKKYLELLRIKSEELEYYNTDMELQDYHSTDESEYIISIAKFRNTHNRPPTLEEGFRIALSLGYRK